MRTMNSSVTLKFRWGCNQSVLGRGKEGQEEKCPSGTGRAKKEMKKRGVNEGKEEEIGKQ
jgi:hypothetical protein